MLQAIHDNLKGIFAMVIIGVLAVVFIFWGVEFVAVGGLTSTQGVSVNGQDLNPNEIRGNFQDELNRYQVAFGDVNVPDEIRSQIREGVIDGAVRTELIRQRTEELRLRPTNAQVLETIRQYPAFQVAGEFSKDAYYAALRSANIEPAVFEAQQKQVVAAQQLDRGLYASSFLLPDEFTRRQALVGEEREMAWVVLPAAGFVDEVTVDDAALAQYYEEHKADYSTPEQANLQYVELDLANVRNEVDASEEKLLAYYEENVERYRSLERRRVSHILITPDGDEAAARTKAQEAFDRAAAGEDFATLARELSQDPGSASAGGDLGWADRATYVEPFADAAWAARPGEIVGPVETQFGWHVIKVDEVEAGEQRSFDEVRPELEAEYRQAEAERLYADEQEQLDTMAFEAGGDLAQVAQDLALQVRNVEGFTRQGGGGFGNVPQLVEAVFDPQVLAGTQLATLEVAPGRTVSIKVVAHEPPRERPLGEVRDQVQTALVQELARGRAAEQAGALVAALRAGETSWDDAAARWSGAGDVAGGQPKLDFVGRRDPAVPPALADAAFRAPAPVESRTYGTAELGSGDVAVFAVAAVRPGSPARLSPAERAQALRETRDRIAMQDAATYVTRLRAGAQVEVNQQLFE
jgi:peptidyl-prolyl cis-trans isomerase D